VSAPQTLIAVRLDRMIVQNNACVHDAARGHAPQALVVDQITTLLAPIHANR
jgi:hypothetical protein